MHPDTTSLQSFYAASASVSGALIGLLFVAVSVAHDRAGDDAAHHQVPAGAALAAFTNTLVVSLFGLIEDGHVAVPAACSGLAGISFVAASLLAIVRHRARGGQNLIVLAALGSTFAVQTYVGFTHTDHSGAIAVQQLVAILTVGCALSGIARSWELIGGRRLRLITEVGALARDIQHPHPEPDPESDPECVLEVRGGS